MRSLRAANVSAKRRSNLASGAAKAEIGFDLPLELRNQVARIEIPSERSAGAVSLIDAATQWHRVGLISGENREQAQPLLAPLYYIQKALKPYAELAVSKDSNLVQGLDGVLRQNVSVLMLADIGTLTGEAAKQVEEFVKRGGVLVRFAGPRLEKAGDELLPVPVARGRPFARRRAVVVEPAAAGSLRRGQPVRRSCQSRPTSPSTGRCSPIRRA